MLLLMHFMLVLDLMMYHCSAPAIWLRNNTDQDLELAIASLIWKINEIMKRVLSRILVL